MKIHIVDYHEDHLPEMVKLFTTTYKTLLAQYDFLPHKYLDHSYNETMLAWLFTNYDGAVAIEAEKVIGYFGGLIVPNFRSSQTGIYTPEWGHGVMHQNPQVVYDELLHHLASKWEKLHFGVHAISTLIHLQPTIGTFTDYSYANFALDFIAPVINTENNQNVTIRKAHVYDWNALVSFYEGMCREVESHPTYLLSDYKRTIKNLETDLSSSHVNIWLGLNQNRIIGIARTEDDCKETCTTVRDRKTLGFTQLYVKPNWRRRGIGTALLKQIQTDAYKQGFKRIAINIESSNRSLNTFLRKHFTPVCISQIRYLDDRLIAKRKME